MPGFRLRAAVRGVALLALCVLARPADAQTDPVAVADAIVAALAAQGEVTATYESAAADGANVIVTGVRVTTGEEDADQRFVELPEVVIAAVDQRETGGFRAEAATFDGGMVKDGGRSARWVTARAGNIVIPSAEELRTWAKVQPFASLELTELEVFRTGAEAPTATVARVGLDLGAISEGQASTVAVDATGIVTAVDQLVPGRRAALLTSLGYETLAMDVAMTGSVDLFANTLVLDPLVVAITDFADLRITGRFSGVSVGGFVAGSRRDAATEAAAIERVVVRFENRGVVGRALDRQAAAMGVERDAFVENFLGAVPFMLNFIGNPPFQAKLATAANTFLREPRTVTLTATPETPVSLDTVLEAIVTNRSALPDLLAVEVKANE